MRGYTTILRNRKSGDYIVQPAAKGPVSTTDFGEPTHIPSQRFEQDILRVVIENLNKYRTQVFDRSLARRFTPEEYGQFIRAHSSISARWEESGDLIIRPLHCDKGGLVARDGEEVVLAENEIEKKLSDVIRDALNQSS